MVYAIRHAPRLGAGAGTPAAADLAGLDPAPRRRASPALRLGLFRLIYAGQWIVVSRGSARLRT